MYQEDLSTQMMSSLSFQNLWPDWAGTALCTRSVCFSSKEEIVHRSLIPNCPAWVSDQSLPQLLYSPHTQDFLLGKHDVGGELANSTVSVQHRVRMLPGRVPILEALNPSQVHQFLRYSLSLNLNTVFSFVISFYEWKPYLLAVDHYFDTRNTCISAIFILDKKDIKNFANTCTV